jgi:hypothetical protein
MDVLADRVTILLKKLPFDELGRLTMLQTISDLRAAYCSTCNKILCRTGTSVLDAKVDGADEFKNKKYACMLCLKK